MKSSIPYLDLRPHDPSLFHIRPLRARIPPEDDVHRHNFQEILWVKAGNGRHQIDDALLDIEPHTFYLITKGQVHRFLGGEGLQGYLLRFTDDFLLETAVAQSWNYRTTLFNQISSHHTLPVPSNDLPKFESLLTLLAIEHDQPNQHGHSPLLRHLLLALLLLLERLYTEKGRDILADGHGENTAVYTDFLTLLEANYKQTHLVADYAQQLNITPRQLSRITQQQVGKGAKQLIDERILLDAKRYLRYSHHSIKEISYLLGYKDPAYFSRIFRHYTNNTPKAYRG